MNHVEQPLGRRTVLRAIGAAGVIGSISGVVAADEHRDALRDLRRVASKYHDLSKAEADGYVLVDSCVANPFGPGAMGFHAANVDLIDDTVSVDEPELLVYEQRGDEFVLVAAEFASTADDTPELFGHEFHPAPPGLPFDWALHVWAWKNNPNGMFADFNPRVSCPSE